MSLTYDYFISYARRDNNGGFIDAFVERLIERPDFAELLGRKPRVFLTKSRFATRTLGNARLARELRRPDL